MRLVARLGHNDGHWIADVTHTICGEDIAGARHTKGMRGEVTLHTAWYPNARQRHHLVFQVRGGHDPHHAGHFQRRAGVNALDARMTMLAAQNCHVQHTRQRQVGGEFGRAAQHLWIFFALEARTQGLTCAGRDRGGLGRLGSRGIGAVAAVCPGRRRTGRGLACDRQRRGRWGILILRRRSCHFSLLRSNARLPKHGRA